MMGWECVKRCEILYGVDLTEYTAVPVGEKQCPPLGHYFLGVHPPLLANSKKLK